VVLARNRADFDPQGDYSAVALSNKIRELRFKNGQMTQKHLAERVGVSRQTMNAIENGRHAPTVDVAIRIADVFGITVDQLFDLNYDGRPVRRENAPTINLDRAEAVVVESAEVDGKDEPVENKADLRAQLAKLRNVMG
jgi:putative transcriptional regulator